MPGYGTQGPLPELILPEPSEARARSASGYGVMRPFVPMPKPPKPGDLPEEIKKWLESLEEKVAQAELGPG